MSNLNLDMKQTQCIDRLVQGTIPGYFVPNFFLFCRNDCQKMSCESVFQGYFILQRLGFLTEIS